MSEPCYAAGVRDPYEVLGVPRNADDAAIKSAFRRLGAQHHPDRNPNDPSAIDRFKEVNLAYQILSDAQKRAAFDRYGARAFDPTQAGPAENFVDLAGIEEMLGELLGTLGMRPAQRGDIRYRLTLSFEEAALGCEREVTYQRQDICTVCDGEGAEPGTRLQRCNACNGRGKVRFQQLSLPIALERPCSSCRGTGQIPASPCSQCAGQGISAATHRLKVEIPAGIEPGAMRKIRESGHRLRPDRAAGDLELMIEVEPHPVFQRSGNDLLSSTTIPVILAALGGEVTLPGLEGQVQLKIPAGVQPGSQLKIKGKGIMGRVGRGDQIVQVGVQIPAQISERAQGLLRELATELEHEPPARRGFLERIKDLFE